MKFVKLKSKINRCEFENARTTFTIIYEYDTLSIEWVPQLI